MEYCCHSQTCSAFGKRKTNKAKKTEQKDNGDEADDEDDKLHGAKKGKKQDGTDNKVLQTPPSTPSPLPHLPLPPHPTFAQFFITSPPPPSQSAMQAHREQNKCLGYVKFQLIRAGLLMDKQSATAKLHMMLASSRNAVRVLNLKATPTYGSPSTSPSTAICNPPPPPPPPPPYVLLPPQTPATTFGSF